MINNYNNQQLLQIAETGDGDEMFSESCDLNYSTIYSLLFYPGRFKNLTVTWYKIAYHPLDVRPAVYLLK